jgi:cytochrome c
LKERNGGGEHLMRGMMFHMKYIKENLKVQRVCRRCEGTGVMEVKLQEVARAGCGSAPVKIEMRYCSACDGTGVRFVTAEDGRQLVTPEDGLRLMRR